MITPEKGVIVVIVSIAYCITTLYCSRAVIVYHTGYTCAQYTHDTLHIDTHTYQVNIPRNVRTAEIYLEKPRGQEAKAKPAVGSV